MNFKILRTTVAAAAVVATVVGVTQVRADIGSAETLAQEVNASVSAATSVIGGLQPAINGGSVDAAAVQPEAIVTGFLAAYEKKTGRPFDTTAAGALGEYRVILLESIREVIAEFETDIVEGGADAFVPAFFRNQVLVRVNDRMDGAITAAVTNRGDDLINTDSAVDYVFEDEAVIGYVAPKLEAGSQDASSETIGGSLVNYWPMTLKDSCVSCHARNGLDQQVGAFGGAMVVIVDTAR